MRAFTKMQGTGNDFVVIDATKVPFEPTPEQLRWLCDRHFGVGADQVLVVAPPTAADVDFDYRIYNADGSPSGQCGNGARCLARFIRDHGLSNKHALLVQTSASRMRLALQDDGQVRVEMPAPKLAPAEVPARLEAAAAASHDIEVPGHGRLAVTLVNMGNPHAVLLVNDVDTAPVAELGAAVQASGIFPDSVNVGFLQVLDGAHGRLRVFERGSGETLACGSGACAAMVAGRLRGVLDAEAALHLRGGEVALKWAGSLDAPELPVYLSGPAETAFEGCFSWPAGL